MKLPLLGSTLSLTAVLSLAGPPDALEAQPPPQDEPCPRAEPTGDAVADSAWNLFFDAGCVAQRGIQHWEAARGIYQEALAVFRRSTDLYGEAMTLGVLGTLLSGLGEGDSAVSYQLEALEIQRAADDAFGSYQTLLMLSGTLFAMNRPDSALAYARSALELSLTAPDPELQGMPLYYVGRAYRSLGRPDSALVYLRQALPIASAVSERGIEGSPPFLAGNVEELARTFGDLGEPDSALVYYRQALAISRREGDARGEARNRLGIGFVHERAGRPDSAVAHYGRAAALARERGYEREEARAHLYLGASEQRMGRPDSAFSLYHRGLALAEKIGDDGLQSAILRPLALLYRSVGEPDSALALLRRAVAMDRSRGDLSDEAASLASMGAVLQTSARPDSARALYRRALQLEGGRRRMSLVRVGLVQNLAQIELTLGRPDSAIAYSERALAMARAMGSRQLEGRILSNMANIYAALGRGDLAFQYLRQGLAAARQMQDRDGEAATLNFLSRAQHLFGDPDSAIASARQALAVAQDGRIRKEEATALINLAFFQQQRGELEPALVGFRLLAIESTAASPEHRAAALSNMATIQLKMDQPDSALVNARRALRLAREARNAEMEELILAQLGRIHQRGLAPPDLSTARAYFDSAATLRAAVSLRAGPDMSRVTFAEQAVGLFESWVLAWLDDPLAADRAPAAALAVAERGRAQALLHLMRATANQVAEAGASPLAAGATGDRTEEGRQLAEEGRQLPEEGRQLAEASTARGVAVLSYLIAEEAVITWMVDPTGDVSVFRRPVGADSLNALIAALRGQLGVDRRVIEERLAARGSPGPEPMGLEPPGPEPTGLRPESVPESEPTPETRGGGRARAEDAPGEAAAVLGAILVPNVLLDRADVDEVIIVPAGPLALVPFAVLPVRAGDKPLGERFALRYAPSLRALLGARGRSVPSRAGTGRAERALVIGNPSMPLLEGLSGERIELQPLPGAEAEARAVASRFTVAPLLSAAASEAAVKAELPRASIVHLATHGYAYSEESRARDSFLALAAGEGEDGLLTVGEIIDGASIAADLVVLSACQTGLGNLKRAEGTVGLQRAFLAKGARSVLVSLWSVSDAATDLLMRRFYAHWLEDEDRPSRAESLRRAQRDVRATDGFAHPRYWAAFQLVGAE